MRLIVSNLNLAIINVSLGILSALFYSFWGFGFIFNREVMGRLDVSALQAIGEPHWLFFVEGDILTGISCVLLAAFLFITIGKTKYAKYTSSRLCIIGLLLFGIFTAVSSILPSCINESKFCNVNPANIFDVHDLTGALASFGLFVSLVAVVQLTDRFSNKLNKALMAFLFVWTLSGLLFVSLSFELNSTSLATQQIFLVLSSLSIVIIPIIINMILKIETS